KELVTMRLNRDASRLVIANGSDESVSILGLPDLHIVREITIEGEKIRDALPDPKGRYLYLLGRHVHVFDANGEHELRALPSEDPMAIATNGDELAVVHTEDYDGTKATAVAVYETESFKQMHLDPLQTTDRIEGSLIAGDALVAISRDHLFEAPLAAR